MTGGPRKDHGTNEPRTNSSTNQSSSGKVERRRHVSYHLPEPFSLESILPEQCVHHQEGSRVRMIGQRQPGSLPHHHKTQDGKPCDLAVLLGSLSLLLSARAPLPNKVSCFVAGVSLWTIHFWVLDKSPLLGTGRGPSPCNTGVFLEKPQSPCTRQWGLQTIRTEGNASKSPNVIFLYEKKRATLAVRP